MKTITLLIDGMACNHCTSSVTNALTALDGVQTVQVSLEEKNAVISYDPTKMDVDTLSTIIDDLGFSVTGKAEA